MPDSSEPRWWEPGGEDTSERPELAMSLADARNAAAERGTALARWRAHRRDCARCQSVRPPAGPAQCCRAGRARLEAYLKASERARGCEAVLAAHRTMRQPRLI